MIFGPTRLDQAEGAILAHSLRLGSAAFKKGRVLSADDVAVLATAGVATVIAARLEADDVSEDTAAAALAQALAGAQLKTSAAFTGRSNLIAETRGVVVLDRAELDKLNAVDESITVATLPPYHLTEPRQIVATIKIIPFAVPKRALDACLAVARRAAPMIHVAPLRPRQVGLVQTSLPGMKESLLDKTKAAVDARLTALDCPAVEEQRCAHDEDAVAKAIETLRGRGCAMVLVSGASAIVDRRDVVPAGMVRAGGIIDHFGMPVDPGNLILLSHLEDMPLVGLPGCARSSKLNGFDWVLQRLLADLPVSPATIMGMGAGGLLKEIASRPLPRAQAVEEAQATTVGRAPRIAALVLAAGQSRRMGPENKLLAEVEGRPMVAHMIEQALNAQADKVVVVTGHERAEIEAALTNFDVTTVHNPDYAQGLSTSLHKGLAALSDDIDGVVICLGDMPRITNQVIDKLIAAFDPAEGRAICVPTWAGKRGNPVLFGRQFFAEMQSIAGDVGARQLIGDYPDAVCEVAMADNAVLTDVDTPEALAALKTQG